MLTSNQGRSILIRQSAPENAKILFLVFPKNNFASKPNRF
jgi:hypothetical protein